MNVTIIGAGYVGLVSGVCLASKGHKVTCVDLNSKVVNSLNQGIPTIFEKNLESLLNQVIQSQCFNATTDLSLAVKNADIIIIAVGTPYNGQEIDLSQIENTTKSIAYELKNNDSFKSIVVKSTVLPGVTDTFVKEILEEHSGKQLGIDFGLGMNPEFLREGSAVEDFLQADRIVIGFEDNKTKNILDSLYKSWGCDKIFTNSRTAEMIKYANNSLLALLISSINEMANFAGDLGKINLEDLLNGITSDKRWNPIVNGKRVNPGILNYLIPGFGYGGSCFPKDTQSLISHANKQNLDMHILGSAVKVNANQPERVIKYIKSKINNISNTNFLLLGLAFKPGTDDVRESVSIKIAELLLSEGAKVSAHDPIAIENFRKALGNKANSINFITDWKGNINSNNVIIVITKWQEYEELSNINIQGKTLVDTKTIFQS